MSRLLVLTFLLACSSVACSASSTAATPEAGAPDACGTGGNDGGTCLGTYVSCADLTTPTVSFAMDIVPIFQPSCAIAGSTCHGTPDVATTQARPYLGNFDGGTDASEVVQGLVSVLSNEDPTMNTVAPGDPVNSFLMHKLDGDQCTLANACASSKTQYTDCGQQMPYSSPPLDEATRDIVRRWIAQGAKNN
ncbi:MAG TPA: hypothetical protein VGL81_05535 [Polyangiaceae bacterium]|jgi:hypothetical protein